MTAVTEWMDSDVESGKKGNPAKVMPGQVYGFACTWEKATGDGDGSVIYVAKVGANMIPVDIKINNDSLAGCTDVDLGFYKENGVVADKDVLMDGADINGGKALGSEQNGLASLGVDNIGKKVYELLGLTSATRTEDSYILALTLNTAGSAAGTVSVRGLFLQG